jgi:ribosomal protein S18 acetylase RimI-like enzyme
MKITDITDRDAGRIVPLLRDLHAQHAEEQPLRYPSAPADSDIADWLSDWMEKDGIQAIAAQSPVGALMGYAIYEIEDQPHLPVMRGGKRIQLHHIAVDPPFRRLGVGQALVTEVKSRCQTLGIDTLTTSFAVFDTASAGLMSSMGLQPVTTVAEWRA